MGAEPKVLCRCGEVWESPVHFTKKGDLRKNLDREKHGGTANMGGRGRWRRAGVPKPQRVGARAKGRQVLPSIATHVAVRGPDGKLKRIQVAPEVAKR